MVSTLPDENASYPVHIAPDFSARPHASGGNDGWLVPLEPNAAITLAVAALLHARQPARVRFLEQLQQLAERLEDLLALDESHAGSGSAGAMASALGGQSGYLDPSVLSSVLARRASPVQRMTPERRERCLRALGMLRQAISAAAAEPPYLLFYPPPAVPNAFGGSLHQAPDPCAAALAYARRRLKAAEETLRALRVARLELDGSYDAARHDGMLLRFGWASASESELLALPPVLVSLTAAQAAVTPIGSLARLLRSACPVHVVITQPALGAEDLGADGPDLGGFALSQRDAFVLQGSLAYLDHLLPGMEAMAASTGPAVAVIAVPSGGGWEEAAMLPLARAWALYTYEPAGGTALRLEPVESEALPADFSARFPGAEDFFADRRRAWEMLERASAPAPVEREAEIDGRAMQQGAERAVARVVAMLINGRK